MEDKELYAELDNCPNPVMKGAITDLMRKDYNQQVELNELSRATKTMQLRIAVLNKKYLTTSGLTIILLIMLLLEIALGK